MLPRVEIRHSSIMAFPVGPLLRARGALAGPVGGAGVGLRGIGGVLSMTPWSPAEMGRGMTMWMAATVLRLLLTPALAYLLYSATSLSGTALGLAIVFSYFLALLAEWVVLDRHINKVLPV